MARRSASASILSIRSCAMPSLSFLRPVTCAVISCLVGLAAAADSPATTVEIRKLVQERVAIVTKVYELTAAAYKQGATSLSELSEAQRALLAARLDAAESKAERLKVLEEMV